MDQPLKWLPEDGGLPVPPGFIVYRSTPEANVRSAYEELKIREKTHFVAVRGPTHAVLNVIGPDPLVHTLRRLCSESPDAPVLVQRMVHSMWCGKAQWHGSSLTITANEGMMLLDPDTYSNGVAVLAPKQRKMIRHVDGTARIIEREQPLELIPGELLTKITTLAEKTGTDIGWAIDDLEKIWLLAGGKTSATNGI
ncbi:MAG TPA: hypothetical protein VGK48_14025 [Terriglobia bacterium]|jgi:hypothetical protein